MPKIYEYDGVVIGAGHNGMICAGYLGKCGLKIMVVEKNMEVGGGLDSHEDRNYPGFWHNIHSVFHRGLMTLPWYKDLELEKFGIHYYRPDPGVAHHFLDGTYLGWFADVGRTAETIRQFSKKDAATFREIWARWQPVVRNIVFPETYSVPVPIGEKRLLLEKIPEGREYLRYFHTTPGQFVVAHFEHPRVRAFIGFLGVMRGYELDAPGTGYLIPAMIAWGVNPQLCRGTSHALGDNLAHMLSHNGVDYIEAVGVERILIERGRAVGVVLENGSVIKTRRFVASTVHPVDTFVKLVGRENLDAEFAGLVERFRFSKTTPIFAVNLALNERPKYITEDKHPEVIGAFMHIVGLETYKDLENLFADCRAGELPRKPFMNGATPSYHDPTQAPPGKATAFMWQLAPYNLWGNPLNWDKVRNEWIEKQLAVWRRYAPNLTGENILSKDSGTPLDIERHDRNMYYGDWMVGEYSGDQALENRPFPGWSQYRMPIEGLYLCGSSCHPGGNITGAPGYNAARIIAEDLGMDPWWKPLKFEEHLAGLR
ncbi:MAG: NAD(P)/FAD-dependent oxidoreductase [Deltaproteobacteria bacterium]|nr:NAD(P)/FAD-dependent oxidoreductase [Deltaproteobacteria bacterium]